MGEADIDFYLEQIKHTKNDEEREDLLNNCCKKFINDSRYKNDARYIKCWIELANYVDEEDSLKVFITMNTHGIGLQLAIFYLGFATVLESTQILDNLRTAIIIYEKGIARKAHPVEKLIVNYEAFKQRLTKKINELLANKPKQQEGQSASYKLGYNKDMICIGDEESSFEELRAKLPKYCYMPPNIHTLRTVTAPQIAVQTDDMDASDDDLDLPLTNQFLLSPLPPQLHARQQQQKASVPSRESRASSSLTIHTKLADEDIGAMFLASLDDDDELFEEKKKNRAPRTATLSQIENQENLQPNIQQPLSKLQLLRQQKRIARMSKPEFPIYEDNSEEIDYMEQTLNVKEALGGKEPTEKAIQSLRKHFSSLIKDCCIDPYNSKITSLYISVLLKELLENDSKRFIDCRKDPAPTPREGSTITLANKTFVVEKVLGRGRNGSVIVTLQNVKLSDKRQSIFNLGRALVCKIQPTPTSVWEYFIADQIQRRLIQADLEEHSNMFVTCVRHYTYEQVSYLTMLQQTTMSFTLQQIISANKKIDETLVIYYTIELLKILECLRKCGIVHGEIIPENLISMNDGEIGDWDRDGRNGWDKKGLSLIDFGKSFDVTLFPCGTKVLHPVTKQPINPFIIDTLSLANLVHVLLCQAPLEVENKNGLLACKMPLKRWFQVKLWNVFFDKLLNSGDLNGLREMFENYIQQNKKGVVKSLFLKLHNEANYSINKL